MLNNLCFRLFFPTLWTPYRTNLPANLHASIDKPGTRLVRKRTVIKYKKFVHKSKGKQDKLTTKSMETFVFIDLETTGLINKNAPMPKITEMAMVAVSRRSLLECNGTEPRVKYKLVLPINPKFTISSTVENITGLSNKNLQQFNSFTPTTVSLLNNFLMELKTPICLVAHNGNRFDYPILLSELRQVSKQRFSDNIYAVDSLLFFKYYFEKQNNETRNSKDISEKLSKPNTKILHTASYSNKEIVAPNQPLKHIQSDDIEISKLIEDDEHVQKGDAKINELDQSVKSVQSSARSNTTSHVSCNKPYNYQLGTIYHHICGVPPVNSHTAEGDCLLILHCIAQTVEPFLQWSDINAVKLDL